MGFVCDDWIIDVKLFILHWSIWATHRVSFTSIFWTDCGYIPLDNVDMSHTSHRHTLMIVIESDFELGAHCGLHTGTITYFILVLSVETDTAMFDISIELIPNMENGLWDSLWDVCLCENCLVFGVCDGQESIWMWFECDLEIVLLFFFESGEGQRRSGKVDFRWFLFISLHSSFRYQSCQYDTCSQYDIVTSDGIGRSGDGLYLFYLCFECLRCGVLLREWECGFVCWHGECRWLWTGESSRKHMESVSFRWIITSNSSFLSYWVWSRVVSMEMVLWKLIFEYLCHFTECPTKPAERRMCFGFILICQKNANWFLSTWRFSISITPHRITSIC